jgi:hypothetical protein
MKYLVENDPWYKDVVPDVSIPRPLRPKIKPKQTSFGIVVFVPNQQWFLIQGEQFRLLKRDELPAGHESGFAFTSVCINTAIYLPWLLGQCLKNGAIVKRGIVSHVSEAAGLHHSGQKADIVINATGLGSAKLGGVRDKDVYPARGQIVLVRNESKFMVTTSGTDDGSDEATYIMQRAAGTLTVKLPILSLLTRYQQAADAFLAVVYNPTVGNLNLIHLWPFV